MGQDADGSGLNRSNGFSDKGKMAKSAPALQGGCARRDGALGSGLSEWISIRTLQT